MRSSNGRVGSTCNYTGIPPHHPMRLSRASLKTAFTFPHMQWALSCAVFVPSLTAKLFQMMRMRLASKSGKVTVLVTDGHLPYPYGREMTGYEVADLSDTLSKAKTAGVVVLIGPYQADQRNAAMLQFPGGYIAEVHSLVSR